MFEILQAYETAKHNKNKVFSFFYTTYVRYKLKSSFFKPFKYLCEKGHNILTKDFLEEFNQFYNCTSKNVYTGINKEEPYLFYVSSGNNVYIIYYNNFQFRFKFLENNCDIEIEISNGTSVFIHPENNEFYTSFIAEIIIMAIYNYCVSYIYGKNSHLYLYHDRYVKKIKSIYF